jgi:hypothetical protein
METYEVTRDGRSLATFRTENEAWRYLLRQQGQSIYYATLHGGYDIIYPNGSSLAESNKKVAQ